MSREKIKSFTYSFYILIVCTIFALGGFVSFIIQDYSSSSAQENYLIEPITYELNNFELPTNRQISDVIDCMGVQDQAQQPLTFRFDLICFSDNAYIVLETINVNTLYHKTVTDISTNTVVDYGSHSSGKIFSYLYPSWGIEVSLTKLPEFEDGYYWRWNTTIPDEVNTTHLKLCLTSITPYIEK